MRLAISIINKILKNAVIIFVYHDVSKIPSHFSKKHDLNISPDIFYSHVKAINNIFNIISPTDLIDGDFKRPAALFTFDDGYKSYFNNALPILEEFNCPSINFINYDVIKGEISWPCLTTYLCNYDPNYAEYKKTNKMNDCKKPEYLFMNENSVDAYIKQSNKEKLYNLVREYQGEFANETDLIKSNEFHMSFLGSHLYKHLNCAIIGNDRLKQMQKRNVKYLSKFPNFINYFAYPFGQPIKCFNHKTNNILAQLKIHKIFSAFSAINFDTSHFLLDRITIDERVIDERSLMFHLAKRLIRTGLNKYYI